MTPIPPVIAALCLLLNVCLLGSVLSLPEEELPPEDVPSFYWASQRFGRVSLLLPNGEIAEQTVISEWKALVNVQQMRVWVSDVWSQLPYDGRYRLVRGLGDIAAREGYSLMVVDLSNTVVATYECHDDGLHDEDDSQNESERRCAIDFNPAATVAEPDPRL